MERQVVTVYGRNYRIFPRSARGFGACLSRSRAQPIRKRLFGVGEDPAFHARGIYSSKWPLVYGIPFGDILGREIPSGHLRASHTVGERAGLHL